MLIIYRLILNLIFLLSPLIIIYRLLKKKEDIKRFKEKFCFFSKKKSYGNLIWFHGASVGEIKSIIPIIEKLERDKKVKKILITSNTLSSSKIISQYKFKKTLHQFFPIDTNFLSQKFLNFWKPSVAFFIDSEIWPNMFYNLEKKKIPIVLLNGRITKKTFKNWSLVPSFSRNIFSKFELCLSSSIESKKFLTKLGAKKVKFLGNLKFSQSEKENFQLSQKLKKFFLNRKIWCASSTHNNEEIFCGKIHIELKKKYKNLLTIIIPRHVDRVKYIKSDLNELNLTVHSHEDLGKIKRETDIYLVNTYGKTKSFYNHCKNVFLGGSLISHGGQNPLEAAQFGCNVLHGPNVFNFSEIYKFLQKNNIAKKVANQSDMLSELDKLFGRKNPSKQIQKKLNSIGDKILKNSYYEIGKLLKK